MASPPKARVALALSFASALALQAGAATAQEDVTDPFLPGAAAFNTLGDWGGIGLLQTRTARFAPDGGFDVGYSFVDPYKRYNLTFTVFPWLEATFRYTEVRNRLYGDPSFSGDQRYKDRGADLKFKLFDEARLRPALAVGFQDLLGTGLFAGEYLVASKRWSDFDFSVGLGWGQIGSGGEIRNPLIALSDGFRERTAPSGTGGQVAFDTFFGGEKVGLFGGLEYRTPIDGVTLKLEYDSHRFRDDDLTHPSESPVNFGVVFRPYSWLELSLGRERGNTTMVRFSLRSNIQSGGLPKQDPPPPPLVPRPSLEQLTGSAQPARTVSLAVQSAAPAATPPAPAPAAPARANPAPVRAESAFDALSARGFVLDDFQMTGTDAIVAVSGTSPTASLRDAAIAVADTLPLDVATLVVVDRTGGTERGREQVRRNSAPNLRYADDLYGRLATVGLNVIGVDVLGNDIEVRVAARNRSVPVDLYVAAREAAAALPLGGSVTAIDTLSGRSETWLAFGPAAPFAPSRFLPTAGSGQAGAFTTLQRPLSREEQDALRRRMQEAMDEQDLMLEVVELQGHEAFVAVTSLRFRQTARNIGLAARIVANNLPAGIERITIALLDGGLEMERITFMRSDLERAVANNAPEELWQRMELQSGQAGFPGQEVAGRYPSFRWSLGPQLRQHIGGPDQFYLYQIWLALGGSVDIARGLSLSTTLGANLYHNFDKIRLESDSKLPHVRSDIKDYLQQGPNNIVRLQATQLIKVTDSVYARVTAGLLEEMYGGAGAEILYRPFASRLALGADWNWVRKRDFDQRFSFLDYKTQTGHASVYYDTPYKGVLLSAHYGRYLAGDRGVTLELSRRFDTGVRLGLWSTFTNITPEDFGEGSFDKGFFIAIPLDLFFTRSAPNYGVFAFRPLTRDGGQRLAIAPRLYDLTANQTLEATTRDWPQLLR